MPRFPGTAPFITVQACRRLTPASGFMVGMFTPALEKKMKKIVNKLVRDESGGEILEYALIAGLIVVAAIAVITAVGTKVLARWNSLNTRM